MPNQTTFDHADRPRVRRPTSETAESDGAQPHPLVALQRSLGNAHINRMLAQREADPDEKEEEDQVARDAAVQRATDPATADEEEALAAPNAAVPSTAVPSAAVPNVGSMEVAFANTPAADALRTPETAEQSPPGATTAPIEEDEEADHVQAMRDATVQRSAVGDDARSEVGREGGPIGDALASRIQTSRGSGSPLDAGTRATMEGEFGTSFAHVRTHADTESDALNRKLGAKAFTTGNDIYFRNDSSPADHSLLAHELTHVVQQRSMPETSGGMQVGPAGDRYEQSADAMSAAVVSGGVTGLQRKPAEAAVATTEAGGAGTLPIQRGVVDTVTDAVGDAFDVRTDEERLDAEEELEDFRSQIFPPVANHKPTTGIGQFDVAFDPRAGKMTVTLKVAYNFVDGDPTIFAPGFKADEFKWTPGEQGEWKTRYQRQMSDAWSSKHQFKSTKAHWSAMVVDTTVNVVEGAADAHFNLTVAKHPPDALLVQSSTCDPGTSHVPGGCLPNTPAADGTVPANGTGSFSSNLMRPEQQLDWGNASSAISFERSKATLGGRGKAALTPVIDALKLDPKTHVELTGHTSSDHKRGQTPDEGARANMELARSRTAAVHAALTAEGIAGDRIFVRNVGEEGATTSIDWCRVDAQVGNKETQITAIHETGHMLGNDDEYPTTAVPAGSALSAEYDAMIKNNTGDVITRQENEGAMSVGSTVKRWNYSSFLEALKWISARPDWGL